MSSRMINENLIRRAPESQEGLLTLLFDGLDWPRPVGMEINDVPLLGWSPEELHLDPNLIARLTRIQQLPALTSTQPFGVFILTFEGGRLPVGAVRRLVSRLIRKKRAQSSAPHSLWNLPDMIFFCQSSSGVGALHIVAFKEADNGPVMKVISWDSHATANRIHLIASDNLSELTWPDISMSDPGVWRDRWAAAFKVTYREGIRTAAVLADHMADVAKVVRSEVKELYDVETESGPLRQLHAEIRRSLRSEMTSDQFADMYSQTMVYGLLTARITHPEDFKADAVNTVLKFENPFLDALYSSFRRQGDEAFDVDEFGLHDLADLLARVDVDQLLADFGVDDHKDDPVVFFYEEFLERYDPQQRRELGTYYTPIPAVKCIIRGVDHIIKSEFGLASGVADRTTWADYSAASGIPVPEGIEPDAPVIRMIDPATGTGTFLLEWLRHGIATLDRTTDSSIEDKAGLIRQMDAFEINLSSYAVANLKASLELPPELRFRQGVEIRLTDTLIGLGPSQYNFLDDDDPVAEEGKRAEYVKFNLNHSVCIGNPPYMRVDRQTSGGWIAHPPDGGHSLFDDIHEPARQHTNFSHQASLFNLYVYFWRWSIWKIFEQTSSGPGVVGFVTASSWLNGPGFLGLRQLVRELADDIYVVDLGGDNFGARADENIFPIQTPVAIVFLVRRSLTDRGTPARVRYIQVVGTREEKLDRLNQFDFAGASWLAAPDGWHTPLTPVAGGESWREHPALGDLLPWQQPGCKFGRTWPIAPDPAILEKRWRRFVATESPVDRARCFVTPSAGRNINTLVFGFTRLVDLRVGAQHQPIVRYGYRSFDRQWAFNDPRLAKTESPSLWASLSNKQIFVVSDLTRPLGLGPALVACLHVPDLDFHHGRGGKDVIPLYRDSDLTPNADPYLLETITKAHRAIDRLAPEVTVERLFAYIYGSLAGADYTKRFSEELTTPGPRVPLSRDPQLFGAMADHGECLLWLQTYGERFQTSRRGSQVVDAVIKWVPEPSRIPVDTHDYRYDATVRRLIVADGILEGISPEVWEFEVSGMPVIKKWLGYRTARGTGRAISSTSPLDQIRPTDWIPEWSIELRELVHVLTATLYLEVKGKGLLEEVLAGELIRAADLPSPPAILRQPPSTNHKSTEHLGF